MKTTKYRQWCGECGHRHLSVVCLGLECFYWTSLVFTACKLASEDMIILCGHYEGVDQRALDLCIDEEISIGDYVLTGGELAAMVVIDAVSRYVGGVLGSSDSLNEESFSSGLLEYPQYTRPADFRGIKVPEVLLSGHHANIEKWRHEESVKITQKMRPDLLK